MWDVLAIAPTDDAKAIRRAYAARLREIDPDHDREAFARLRAALEAALADAHFAVRQAPAQPLRDEVPAGRSDAPPQTIETVHLHRTPQPPAPGREAVPETACERAEERARLIALESALQRGDAHEASRLYFRAAATGAVPLGDTERMLVRLFTVALADASFDGAAFRGLAQGLGWDQPRLDSAAVSHVRQRVVARLAAEDWYDILVVAAERKTFDVPRSRAKVARLILRRIRGVGLWRVNRRLLREFLDQLKPHEVWLRDRIPPEWIASLENRMRRRELIVLGISMLFIGGLLVNRCVVLMAALLREGFSQDAPLLALLAALLAWVLKVIVVNFVTLWRQRAA